MKKKELFLVLIMIVLVTGCTYLQPVEETPEEGITFVPIEEIPVEEGEEVPLEEITGEIIEEEPEEEIEPEELLPVEPEEPVEKPKPGLPRIEVVEGELVKLALKATDADGDKLTYKFSAPLNDKGEWQTEEGDHGEYEATVTVSDGKAETSKEILIVVKSKNKAPILETLDDVEVNEGDTVSFDPKATDPDGDDITITYSGWMSTASYKTTFDDAGEHKVKVTASDGKDSVSQEVKVKVANVNRAPILQTLSDIKLKEGEKVSVTPVAADPDKDNVYITYSQPLDKKGEWQTKEGDAGNYEITVTASDGSLKAEKKFNIEVEALNKPPVISSVEISVDPDTGVEIEGLNVELTLQDEEDTRTIMLDPKFSDPDGDKLTISYSGFMSKSTKEITWDDGGKQEVTIKVTDGKATVTKKVTIDVNRAPQFEI